jgi:hypothetical protein
MQMGGDDFQKGGNNVSRTHHVVGRETLAAELHTPQMHEFHRMDAREQHFNEVIEHLRILILHSHQHFQRNYLFVAIPYIPAHASSSTVREDDLKSSNYPEPFSDLEYKFSQKIAEWAESNRLEMATLNSKDIAKGSAQMIPHSRNSLYFQIDMDSIKLTNAAGLKVMPRFTTSEPVRPTNTARSESKHSFPTLPGSNELDLGLYSVNKISIHNGIKKETPTHVVRDPKQVPESNIITRGKFEGSFPHIFWGGNRNRQHSFGGNIVLSTISSSVHQAGHFPVNIDFAHHFANLGLKDNYSHEACSGLPLDPKNRQIKTSYFVFTWAELNSVRPARGPARGQVSRREVDRSRLNN